MSDPDALNVAPTGLVMSTTTLLASAGPALVTMALSVRSAPTLIVPAANVEVATERSLWRATVDDTVLVLLLATASVDVLLKIDRALESVEPPVAPAGTMKSTVKVAEPPEAMALGVVHLTGVPSTQSVDAWNVAPEGTGTLTTTVAASEGPAFATLTVMAMTEPALTLVGADDAASEMSLARATVVESAFVSSPVLAPGDESSDATVSVEVSDAPEATLEGTAKEMVKEEVAPTFTVPTEHVMGPLPVQVIDDDVYVVPSGTGTVTDVLPAADGPALPTVTV